MGINGVTPLAGLLSTGGLQSLLSPLNTAGNGSTSGPAFVLGGSTPNFAQGVYNSLGALLGTRLPQAKTAEAEGADKSDDKRTALLKSAAEKIDSGDPQGGRAEAEKVLAQNASDLTALRLVAHSYLAERDYKQAERYYARAVALAPTSDRLRGDLANVRSLQKDDEDVLADARRQLGSPAQRSNGLRLLLLLSERSPNNVEAYLALADGYDAAKQPTQVIGALQEAVRLAGQDRIGDVITRASKLANDFPDVGLTHNILGRALQKAGRFDQAVRELKAATDIAPFNGAYRGDLASGYAARAVDSLGVGDAAAAQADLQSARALDPTSDDLSEASARIAAERARRFVAAGSHKMALGELATASTRAPDDEQFKKKLAALYTRVGVYFRDNNGSALALSSFTKAYELDPTSATVRRNVEVLAHQEGLSALNAKNYDAAITYLDQARRTNTLTSLYRQDLARAYDARGQLRQGIGKLADAIDDFKKGFALDPSNSSLNANLSSALAQSASS